MTTYDIHLFFYSGSLKGGQLFTETDLLWLSESCERQSSSPISVAYMGAALSFARTWSGNESVCVEDIVLLGLLVNPEISPMHPWRTQLAYHKGQLSEEIGAPPSTIPRAVEVLCEQTEMSASEFYQEFQEIHPFIDGNGRVGAILFNWLNRTITMPVHPPEFKRAS